MFNASILVIRDIIVIQSTISNIGKISIITSLLKIKSFSKSIIIGIANNVFVIPYNLIILATSKFNKKHCIITYPTIASFVLFVPLIFVALYFGAPVIADVVAKLEGTVFLHILDVVGGGLAAIGIATTIYVIGRKDYLLFFLLAYFLSVILKDMNVNMLVYAILGTIISILAVGNKNQAKEDKVVKTETSSERELTFEEEDDF